MGDNPSRFRDDTRHPVENVTWKAVDGFLQRVQELLPGVAATLPSEAEREYACRAGSETAFNFGETISAAQANYDGRLSYAGGVEGAYLGRAVAVKSYPTNAWGLYEMHGNVWEWCADGRRTYQASPVEDPRGPEGDGAPRVVRGGSWHYSARRLRSASRNRRVRDYRNDYLGFRFSLRSMV